MTDRFENLLDAPVAERQQVARSLYEELDAERIHALDQAPSKRRIKRISLYRRIIGTGHQRILELGCGIGDVSHNLLKSADHVLGTDISRQDIELAQKRGSFWHLDVSESSRIEFRRMSAVQLDLPDEHFDWAISTSMVEHLHPEDVDQHLHEVRRVLKSGGSYLIWCPNGSGHHGNHEGHLTMLSYRQWIDKMRAAGFCRFRSTLTSRPPVVGAGWKVFLETILCRTGAKVLWSHLGVRNVLLIATK